MVMFAIFLCTALLWGSNLTAVEFGALSVGLIASLLSHVRVPQRSVAITLDIIVYVLGLMREALRFWAG